MQNKVGQIITRGSRVYEVTDVCSITNEITLEPVKNMDVKGCCQNVDEQAIDALIETSNTLGLTTSLADSNNLRDVLFDFFKRKV